MLVELFCSKRISLYDTNLVRLFTVHVKGSNIPRGNGYGLIGFAVESKNC